MAAKLKLLQPMPFAWRDQAPLVFFLFFYFLLALLTYQDFGVSWDEYDCYSIGDALRHALFGAGGTEAFTHSPVPVDRWLYYFYFYHMVLNFLNPSFSPSYFHWLNFLFASSAFVVSYEMLLHSTRKPWWSLLGPVFLLLTPQFSGQIPFNPRDVPFAFFYFMGLGAVYFLAQSRSLWKPLLWGLLFGLASIRAAAFTLYPISILFGLYVFGIGREKKKGKDWAARATRLILEASLVFAVSGFFLAVFWPFLGSDFFRHGLDLLRGSIHYIWNGQNSILNPQADQFLFMGRMVESSHLPWNYIPVWILVSTPLFILFFAFGAWFFIKKRAKNPLAVLLAGTFLLNLGLFILLRPVVYLGLRHFLFVLPPLATLAALSAVHFFTRKPRNAWTWGIGGAALLNVLLVVFHLIALHPYEYVYFNEAQGGLSGAYGKFEIEYMGTSAKEAVEWISKNAPTDPRRSIGIKTLQEDFQVLPYLTPGFHLAEGKETGDFLLTLPYSGRHRFNNIIVHSISREGVPLMDIYGRERAGTHP
jgi:hypothetical protein